MHLARLHLEHFRNLETTDLALGAGFNYVYGPNGAGKTALLEAVHTLSRGRSFRAGGLNTLIAHGAGEMRLRAEVTGAAQRTLALARSRSGSTTLSLDRMRCRRMSEFARLLPVNVLLPDAGGLVLEGPAHRRAFLDWGLFHVEPRFLECARRYRRALQQRNAWLKGAVAGDADPWADALIEYGVALTVMRTRYIERLETTLQEVLGRLAPELDVALSHSDGGFSDGASARKKLSESSARDVKFGLSHVGPHRADLAFRVEGHAAAAVVSRGQAKMLASAAIIAQVALRAEVAGRRGVLLIDDFGAELDDAHVERFIAVLASLGGQVIATSTLAPDWAREACDLFHVEQGRIRAEIRRTR